MMLRPCRERHGRRFLRYNVHIASTRENRNGGLSSVATIPKALAIALQHHQAGRLQQAEPIYREILRADPNHADALHRDDCRRPGPVRPPRRGIGLRWRPLGRAACRPAAADGRFGLMRRPPSRGRLDRGPS